MVSLKDETRTERSLYGAMNGTSTRSGGRLLRSTLLQPPLHRPTIEQRLDAVQQLLKAEPVRYPVHLDAK